MIPHETLDELRSGVAEFLERLQAREEFRRELDALPPTPESLKASPFGTVRWEAHLLEQSERPADPEGVIAYRDALKTFARDYLDGASWGARAIHTALANDRRIRLPASREVEWVVARQDLSWTASVDYRPGQPYPASVAATEVRKIRDLADALEANWDQSPTYTLRNEAREHRASLRNTLERRGRGPKATEAADALTDDDPLKPPSNPRPEALRKALNRAEGAIQTRLARRELNPNERQALHRARRLLDGAVNAEWDAPPMDSTDDPGFFTRSAHRKRQARAAGFALDLKEPSQPSQASSEPSSA